MTAAHAVTLPTVEREFVLEYPCWIVDEPVDREALERLCSDDRVEEVWRLTAALSDDEFWGFGEELYTAWIAGRLHREHQAGQEDVRAECANARAALARVLAGITRLSRLENVKSFRDLPTAEFAIQWVDKRLVAWDEDARIELRDLATAGTRKRTKLHVVEFIGLTHKLMRQTFGKPYHELVANMTEVLFEKEVTGDAVRQIARDWVTRRKALKAVYLGPAKDVE
jgi:hypothetical protein